MIFSCLSMRVPDHNGNHHHPSAFHPTHPPATRNPELRHPAHANPPEMFQQLDLPQRPHTEHGMIERCDSFDGYLGRGGDVDGGSVGAKVRRWVGRFDDWCVDCVVRITK